MLTEQTYESLCQLRSLLYSEPPNSACPILPQVNAEDLLLAYEIYLVWPQPISTLPYFSDLISYFAPSIQSS